MGEKRVFIYCSSAIENFSEKFQRKFRILRWSILGFPLRPAWFFGMYNWVDYLKFIWHWGSATIFWCGGDILNLQKRPFWQKVFQSIPARHFCENNVEYNALMAMGIKAYISPSLVDELDLPISFKPSKTPHVFLCVHRNREIEYGLGIVAAIADKVPEITFHIYGDAIRVPPFHKNIIYHGEVPDEQFNEEIKNYQAGLRLNEFEGFSEVLAKSVLMGQYPISRIKYPHIDYFGDMSTLIKLLKALKTKTKPNLKAAKYWYEKLNNW